MNRLDPSDAMSALSDIREIRDFFGHVYRETTNESQCDKHGRGFNLDARFSGTGGHQVSFDSWCGYYGSSCCKTFLCIRNRPYFWECFDAWLNANMEQVMTGVADEMQRRVGKFREAVEKERDGLNLLLEKLGAGERNGETI